MAVGSLDDEGCSAALPRDWAKRSRPQLGTDETDQRLGQDPLGGQGRTVEAVNRTVTYDITNGCYEDQSVYYVSFDSSNPTVAAIEDVTFAPALGDVPSEDCGTADTNQS